MQRSTSRLKEIKNEKGEPKLKDEQWLIPCELSIKRSVGVIIEQKKCLKQQFSKLQIQKAGRTQVGKTLKTYPPYHVQPAEIKDIEKLLKIEKKNTTYRARIRITPDLLGNSVNKKYWNAIFRILYS